MQRVRGSIARRKKRFHGLGREGGANIDETEATAPDLLTLPKFSRSYPQASAAFAVNRFGLVRVTEALLLMSVIPIGAALVLNPASVMFWLKKVVALWLMPLPFCLALLVAGLWLLHRGRRPRLGRGLVATGTALLLLLSNKAVSRALLAPLETLYPPIPEFVAAQPIPANLAACRYVVVLGGGHVDTDHVAAVNRLSDSSRSRLVEGLRLLRALPDAHLIVSGRGTGSNPSHASVMAQAAVSLGVDPARIIRLDSPRDTSEETTAVGLVVGPAPFALVTSAWHLRRAMALMERAGLHPVPCPADYLALNNADFRWRDCTWDSESLERSTWAVYERLGYAWAWWRDKI